MHILHVTKAAAFRFLVVEVMLLLHLLGAAASSRAFDDDEGGCIFVVLMTVGPTEVHLCLKEAHKCFSSTAHGKHAEGGMAAIQHGVAGNDATCICDSDIIHRHAAGESSTGGPQPRMACKGRAGPWLSLKGGMRVWVSRWREEQGCAPASREAFAP